LDGVFFLTFHAADVLEQRARVGGRRDEERSKKCYNESRTYVSLEH
jgi:hypothetical protein